MSRKKLLLPLIFRETPPVIDTSQIKQPITQQEFEVFWNLLKSYIQSTESQLKTINTVNVGITAVFTAALILSAFGIILHPVIIMSLLIAHFSVYITLLSITKKQNWKKRELFLERENRKRWKPRGLRWSIEKSEDRTSKETLVLSEDNEITINFNEIGNYQYILHLFFPLLLIYFF